MKGKELRAAILLFLDEGHRTNPESTVADTDIAERLDAPLEEIRRQLDILEEGGYTNAANTFGGHNAWLAPKGMAMAEELREASEAAEPPGRPIGFD